MGPYCKFCDNRCFIPHPSETPKYIYRAYKTNTIIATCRGGQDFEMERLGYSYDLIRQHIEIVKTNTCAVCHGSLDTDQAPIAENDGYGKTIYVHPGCHPENQEVDAAVPTRAKKTKRVSAINLVRQFTVYVGTHARRNTQIWMHRDRDDGSSCGAKLFETNPVIRAQGKISDASVLRVKRVQNLVLAAQAKEDEYDWQDPNQNPYLLSGAELERAVKLAQS